MKFGVTLFLTLIGLIGISLIVLAIKIGKKTDDCGDTVRSANHGILVIGTMMLSITATFYVCGCTGSKMQPRGIGLSFILLMGLLSLVVIILSSMIHSGCSAARSSTRILIPMGVFGILFCFVYLGMKGYLPGTGGKKMPQPVAMKQMPDRQVVNQPVRVF